MPADMSASEYGVGFDLGRMKTDPVYNAALGAAELGGLIEDYRGSYIMTFAAYNAGRGSVKKWIERYGDPRDPKVDAVDWVEQIPFSETRNYVQRIMENLQVYRARFGGGTRPKRARKIFVGLFDAGAAVQVGLDLQPRAAAEARAIDLQILHDPLHVVARLGERDAFDPVDRVDLGIARIAVTLDPFLTLPRPAL